MDPVLDVLPVEDSDIVCTSGGMNAGGEYNPGQGGENITNW